MVSTSVTRLVSSLIILASSASAEELKVDVYEGPTDCSDENKVQNGNYLSMHYTGKIHESSATGEKGKIFDSSRERDRTFDFQIGLGQVIQGWDQGLIGLCVGAKANLIIPPEMGYGEQGAGGVIPGGATLHFDVEVVSVNKDGPKQENIFAKIDTDGDGKLTKDEVSAFFKSMNKDEVPPELWEAEDKNSDGVISWEEFSGPKGSNPMGDEL